MGHGSSRGVLLAKELWNLAFAGRILCLLFATSLAVGTSASASATDLVGTVTNGTTKKPAAGDEVVLLSLSEGSAKETARAKTDTAGRFRFTVAGPPGRHLVRVIHQDVIYEMIYVGDLKRVEVRVYDVVNKLDGVTAVMDVQRFEARGDKLEVKELVTMRNASKAPRTLMNDRSFEIHLPPEAQVQSGLIQIEDGQPLREKPTPGEKTGEYYFRFPLRPGDTRFAVVYQLPYNGHAVFEPEIRDAQERFVVMLPKSMRFEPKAAGIFRPMPDVSPDNVQGTAPVTLGQTLAFRISGTGMLAELQGSRQQALSRESPAAHGGGLARPPESPGPPPKPPGPSQNHDSFILVGLTVALTAGTVYFYLKKRSAVARARALTYTHDRHLGRRTAGGIATSYSARTMK